MALPPAFKTATPASVAFASQETTMALRARTGWAASSPGNTKVNKSRQAIDRRILTSLHPLFSASLPIKECHAGGHRYVE